ncbi:cytosine permease [Oceanimonas marisflavi]|uniref:cytosine permease n=1 Tax=Oceanimonas marisflavi TaxID=2059724 RepID=UPI000D32465D|nr:cytosine permease [Oceanimonas marisflavi]
MNRDTSKRQDSPDGILPVAQDKRPMTQSSYALVFWSSGIIVQIMVIGQYLLYPTGSLNFIQVLAAGIVASIGVALLMTFQGHAGMKYGIPFIVQGRTSFGTKGTKFVAILRCIPAIAWNGIGTWIGALALEQVTNTLFGFSNVWVYFFLILSLQSILAYRGIETISKFNGAMSFIIFSMLIYFFYVVFSEGNIDFSTASEIPGSWGLAWIAGMMAAFANWTTVILNSSDLTRQINPKGKSILKTSAIANFAGVLPPWLFMIVSGMFIGLATGSTDPIAGLVQLSPNPVFGIVLLVFIILAQITSNLTLNILPPALAFQDIFKTSWRGGIIYVSILSVVTAPWLLFSSDYFFKFQNFYSSFLGPAAAIMIADYFIIRKRKLNIEKLYDENHYNYKSGFSPVGMGSLICGAIVSFLFLDYSWLIGFPFTFMLFLTMKKLGADQYFEKKVA